MVVHILCPECNEDLSEIYPFYNEVKVKFCKKILSEESAIDVDKIDFKSDILVKFDFILNGLKINKMCCRSHILGNTEFDTLY
jgi:DNA-directed RNA polymerase subunit N (RpoN/RPB10)